MAKNDPTTEQELREKAAHHAEQAYTARQAGDRFLADANHTEAIRLNNKAREARRNK
ncbi:hypothetical protein HNR12_002193 [Streptomonospora nanhaiensis]|uniref:Uncharacterized protein n=1 Tax=Streptomonospora nanhaiensis TaxID=1323731 RepID=A0A853BMU5_9ACTN|nr:hypothetical protein [Streptomonospora nanhaiensis]NYI95916.1 hypothetical protein [Streptomonospora nanhaiensis]